MKSKQRQNNKRSLVLSGYDAVVSEVASLLEAARHTAARSINAVMTGTYWQIGRRIVEHEQKGQNRADYGIELLERLSRDLTKRCGRGFSRENLRLMRLFYLAYSDIHISQTPSGKLALKGSGNEKGASKSNISQTLSGKSLTPDFQMLARRFPLPWSHYAMLVTRSRSPEARAFYEIEALRGGWTARQLDRQLSTQFYERTALSRDKAAMLQKGGKRKAAESMTPEEALKSPFVLEFLGLKDEYSESDLEEALIRQLEQFLMELGGDFTFVGRQRRLRIGNAWYRIDLLFFNRRLRCLLVIDLKLGPLTPGDSGQMNMYLNFAGEHWTHPSENPPVGLILCTEKDAIVAKYALDGLPNKMLAAEYKISLPNEKVLAAQMQRERTRLEQGMGKPR